MNGRRLMMANIAAAVSCCCMGVVRDTVEINERAWERVSVDKQAGEVTQRSPISIIGQYDTPLANVYGTYTYGASTQSGIEEFGAGHNVVGGHLDGYLNIRGSYMRGSLDYSDGQIRKVGACLSAQPDVLWPIIEGAVGERAIHRSDLDVKATFARDMRRWAIGLGLSCRAIHESGTESISPKNFSCDMKAQLALAKLTDRYRIGAEVAGRKYSQDDEVKAETTELGKVYVRTGLSQVSKVTGTDLEEWGNGLELAAFIVPRRGYAPLTVMTRFSTTSVKTEVDTVVIGRVRTRAFDAEASYKMREGGLIKRVQLNIGIDQRRVRDGGDYDNDAPRMTGMIVGGAGDERRALELGLTAGFGKWRERAGALMDRIETCCLKGGTAFAFKRQGRTLLSAIEGELEMEIVTSEDTDIDATQVFAESMARRAAYYSENRMRARVSVPLRFRIGRGVSLLVAPGAASERHSGGEVSRRVDFRLGMSF